MMSFRIASSRLPVSRAIGHAQARCLSSEGEAAVTNFRCVLEEYRRKNYTQALPSRFRKDIIDAATGEGNCGSVDLNGIMRVLKNIGAEQKVSTDDVKIIFNELGNGSEIPVPGMEKIL